MKTPLNTIIVGAGGVASYLLPPLAKQFDLRGIIIDGDILEKRNLDRQLFREQDTGTHKSVAIHAANPGAKNLVPVQEYLREDEIEQFCDNYQELLDNIQYGKEMSVILCMVDNHPARRAALALGDRLKIPVIIGANETLTGQVMIWHPRLMEQKAHPCVRYPDMKEGKENDPTDVACTDEEAPIFPQLAGTNFIVAGLMLQMLYILRLQYESGEKEWPDFRVIEYQTTHNKIESITYEQI